LQVDVEAVERLTPEDGKKFQRVVSKVEQPEVVTPKEAVTPK